MKMRSPAFIRPHLASLVFVAWLSSSLLAQNSPNPDAQIKNKQLQQQALPGLREVDAEFDGDDDEFGKILTLQRSKSWYVTPFASARGYWTSNALLANKSEKGDTIFTETQGLNAGYRFSSDWQIFAGYNYQLTRYDENPALDTDANSTEFGTTYKLPWEFQIGTGVRGLWLTAPHQGVEVYRENNPYATISQSHNYLDNRLTWFYGYEYDHKFTNPVGFERDEHTVYMGTGYSWMSNLLSQLVIRQNYQFYDFRPPALPVNGRQEWVSSVILQTVWQPLPWLQVSGFSLASYDNSVNSTRDYKVANAGGEIKFFWKF